MRKYEKQKRSGARKNDTTANSYEKKAASDGQERLAREKKKS